MTRIIGHMVTRNEYGRYLTGTLPALAEHCDEVVVYDDQSDDGTLELARSTPRVHVRRRPDTVMSFADNESVFRQEAWWAMENLAHPEYGDWILCLDADEFLIINGPDDLHRILIDSLQQSLALPVDEVFGYDAEHRPLIRLDGYWGQITAARLVRWKPCGVFEGRIEGGGSVPSAWGRRTDPAEDLRILHLGYAEPADRSNKYERYRTTAGHNPTHVASIKGPSYLQPWIGQVPPYLEAVS